MIITSSASAWKARASGWRDTRKLSKSASVGARYIVPLRLRAKRLCEQLRPGRQVKVATDTVRKVKRRSIRLKEYDYTQPGAYFVTICAHDRRDIWGKVRGGVVTLNGLGQVIGDCWENIPAHFSHVRLDQYCVMPNHLHGILLFTQMGRGTIYRAPTTVEAEPLRGTAGSESPSGKTVEQYSKPTVGSLPTIIRTYKAAVTRHARRTMQDSPVRIWQRGYFERVIRDEREFEQAREYIANNPAKWELDTENPAVRSKETSGSH